MAFKYSDNHKECLENALSLVKGPRGGKTYGCQYCAAVFTPKDVEVDHIIPIKTNVKMGLVDYFEKLFCNQDNLQVLCKVCHKEKTLKGGNKDDKL